VDVIERATEHDPARRFEGASAMETALAAGLVELTVGGRDSVQRRRSFGYRLAATITAVLVVSGAVSAAVWRFGPDSLIERQRQSTPVIPATPPAPRGAPTSEMRVADSNPAPEADAGPSAEAAAPPLRLNAGDWILVADIDNRTGEEVLDGTIAAAIKRELEYSEFVRVAQRDRVEDALRALGQPLDSRIDRGLARKMALRDGGLHAELAGSVDKVPGGYEITLDVIGPGDDRAVMSVKETVASQRDILPAVRKQLLSLREALGETPASVDRSRKLLASVRVPSIRALHLYTQATAMMDLRDGPRPDRGAVERIARLAVQEDPMFAPAVILLAWRNPDPPEEDLRYAEHALKLADTATPQERYFIIGSFHHMNSFAPRGSPMTPQRREALERAVAAYEALFALQPDYYELVNNLRNVYGALGRDRDRAAMDLRLAEARPLSVIENLGVANRLLREDNLDGARRYAARAESALPRGAAAAPPRQAEFARLGTTPPALAAQARLFSAYIAWLQDDPREALRIADRVLATAGTLYQDDRREIYSRLWTLYAALGRMRQAERTVEALRGTDGTDSNRTLQSDLAEAQFLLLSGQVGRLRELLAVRAREPLGPDTPPYLAGRIDYLIEVGLLELAERDLKWFKQTFQPNAPSEGIYENFHAGLERVRGNPETAILGFEKAKTFVSNNPQANAVNAQGQFLASHLAAALESVGRVPEAIAELERVGPDRVGIVSQNTLGRWLRGRAQLARLYRKNGQDKEARELEADLLKLLAMADADHPLVQELRARSAVK
jgi:hypothetical protein